MRIAYVGHTRFPTEKAHGHQIAHVCSAMAALDHQVTLVTPTVHTPITEDPFSYYAVPQTFRWIQLPSFDALHARWVPMPLSFAVAMWSYRKQLRLFLAKNQFDLLYCRSHAVLLPMLKTGAQQVILELHRLPRFGRRRFVRLCNRCAKVVCLTSPMRDRLVSWGVDSSRTHIEGDAVDLSRFAEMPPSDVAKKHYDLPTDRPVIGYVGRLKTMGMEKGVADLLHAIHLLTEEGRDVQGFIVGGPENDRKEYEKGSDARFTGTIPSQDIPCALAACDILAMPFPDFPHYRENMSPLKMFEYMAAGKPIVTSDLPAIRDVLSEETAFFCTPGDVWGLSQVLKEVIDQPEEAARRSANAKKFVKEHSWEKRMGRILITM